MKRSLLLFAALLFSACDQSAPDPSAFASAPTSNVSETPPVTEAPDLVSVGNFREGPATDDGTPQTLVDYTFDQAAYLNGGNRSAFSLIPLDAGDPLNARGVEPAADAAEGDDIVTVLFEGVISPEDYARGIVASGVVNSACCNVGPENPANINQSAIVSNGGITENPDVIAITIDGDQVLFEFDEALTSDDVVQNNSGLQVFFPETDANNTIRSAGALAVKRASPTVLRAYYGEDLPEGYTLQDAVGGFVESGSVQAADDISEAVGNDGKNAFDELAPLGNTGAVVCAPAPETGELGDESGPTEAPDLLAVGNFRRGPFTTQFEPTTCVDFVFDQPAYLKGTRSGFNLVPLDASDALPGSTNQSPEDDEPGDVVVTVIFPGDLSPEDFARGYVDSEVVNSDAQNTSADNPLNINQAANIEPNTATENPDLVQNLDAVERQSEVWLYFIFDEPLTDDDIVQSTSGLRVYFPATTQSAAIPSAGAVKVKRVNETTLRAKFKDLPEGYKLSDAVGAYVVQGSVQAAPGSQGGNDGKSAFDETFLNLDFPGTD